MPELVVQWVEKRVEKYGNCNELEFLYRNSEEFSFQKEDYDDSFVEPE